jgi:hypothetical protein
MRNPRTTNAGARPREKSAPLIRPAHKSSRNLAFYARTREAINVRFTRNVQLMRTRHRRACGCAQNLHPVCFNGDSLRNSKSNERESPDA